MKPLIALVAFWCVPSLITGIPHFGNKLLKREEIVSGCSWCAPGPWAIEPGKLAISAVQKYTKITNKSKSR